MHLPEALQSFPHSDMFDIIDATKLKCFKDCPRKFFYNYVLHWKPFDPNIHLEFGVAWHLAKEHLFQNGFSQKHVDDAYAIFLSHYRRYFSEMDDVNNSPKDAGNAYKALSEYARQFGAINERMEVLASEVSGRISLTEDITVSVKIDLIVRDDAGIWILDHKTGSRDSITYDDSWFLSEQMNLYTHALYCMYPSDKVQGAYVDMSILRKMGNLHKRLTLKKSFEHLQEWYTNCQYWIERLQAEFEWLPQSLDSAAAESHLAIFPKNTESCTKYGRCPYFDLCLNPWNPLRDLSNIPQGFKCEPWNPHASDKVWTPKLILDPDGTTHPPTADELYAYTKAREALSESQAKTELDDFNPQGLFS